MSQDLGTQETTSLRADFLVVEEVVRNRSPAHNSLLTGKRTEKNYETRARKRRQRYQSFDIMKDYFQFP